MFKKRQRRDDVVSWESAEKLREIFKLGKTEFADLLGFGVKQYRICSMKGTVPAHRYYGAKSILTESLAEDMQKTLEAMKNVERQGRDED